MRKDGEEREMEGALGREGFKGWARSHCQAASKRERKKEREVCPGRPTLESVCADWDE